MDFTEQQVEEFNAAYDLARKKMKGLVILENYRPGKMNFFEKFRAKSAIKMFEKALKIHPEHWPSLFFVGKLYQRMGLHEKSLFHFESALSLEHENHSLPQEAALAAMHLHQIDKAIAYSAEALKRKPGDYALLGNHSMNLLIAGLDNEAFEAINSALTIMPDDEINLRILQKVTGVISGKVKRPTFADAI